MDRREFIAGMTSAALLSLMDPGYLAAREALAADAPLKQPVPRRTLGSTGEKISVIGFGGMTVSRASAADTANWIAESFDRGINYYDTAPAYRRAQEVMGPALKPYRDRIFLACKTGKRDAAGARAELENSLKLLQTDHLDLYQMHSVLHVEDVDRIFAPGGAMEVFAEAKTAGKVRYLGFSAHSEEAALALLDHFDFDSVMFPLSFNIWWNGSFGPAVHKRLVAEKRGILSIKPMALAGLTWEQRQDGTRPHAASWYVPLDRIDQIGLALRFAANLPCDAMLPPGEWDLVKIAIEMAQAGSFTPLNDAETELLKKVAAGQPPVFSKTAAV